jgi:hypothetical protein
VQQNPKTLKRLLLVTTILILSSAVAAGIYTQTPKSQKKPDPERTYEAAKVTAAPRVISIVKDLEISGVTLINPGTPEAAVTINVTNKRDEDVMALDFIAGQSTYSGLSIDGLLEEDVQSVIIPRQSLKAFTWNLASIMEGETISLAAAVFSDGKEEGDKHFLNSIKKSRLHYQQKRREEKARNGGQQ